ncbi:MAG: cbb3-type cytochrome oxidase assembly protein CcoS [Sulfuricella sp.]|nr:cbb3-type cytochrome oxidase assembly protein CcoS [Sulfuricella sp.]
MSITILFYLLSGAVVMAMIAGLGIFWAIKSGQFDDMEGPAQRILMDDDDPMIPRYRLNEKKN